MVALDQTKLLMAGVMLGFMLAVLLIRPEIFPSEPGSEIVDSTEVSSSQEVKEESGPSQQELHEWQERLEKRQAAQKERQEELEELNSMLDQPTTRRLERSSTVANCAECFSACIP
mgnify:CR=1 FL=1